MYVLDGEVEPDPPAAAGPAAAAAAAAVGDGLGAVDDADDATAARVRRGRVGRGAERGVAAQVDREVLEGEWSNAMKGSIRSSRLPQTRSPIILTSKTLTSKNLTFFGLKVFQFSQQLKGQTEFFKKVSFEFFKSRKVAWNCRDGRRIRVHISYSSEKVNLPNSEFGFLKKKVTEHRTVTPSISAA